MTSASTLLQEVHGGGAVSAVTPGEARALAMETERQFGNYFLVEPVRSLAEQVDKLTERDAGNSLTIQTYQAQVEAMTAELELARMKSYWASISNIAIERDALRKDANRYRFMRDEFAKESSDAAGAFAALEPMTGVDFDAAIDAAMGEVK